MSARDDYLPPQAAPTRQEIDRTPGLVVLEFGTHWCGICQAARPRIAAALQAHPEVRHIKVEDGPGRKLGRSFRVKLWPNLVLLRDGAVIRQLARPSEDDLAEGMAALTRPPLQETTTTTTKIENEDENARALEPSLLAAARHGDATAFERLVAPRRRELYAHCYRISGSVQDAEDALQESLLAAWRGLASFEGRSSLRTWLYQVTTHACLRVIAGRPARLLSPDHGPPRHDTGDLGEPITGPVWVEPCAFAEELDDQQVDGRHAGPEPTLGGDPAARYLQRESVELAFVAALQHLPATQRAVLILREVLDFSAAETGEILDTTVASVNSALQRARQTMLQRVPAVSQHAELKSLGSEGLRQLVNAFVTAWERADVPALLALLTEDVRFTMPPLPAWFEGRADVGRFLSERVFATPWRLLPIQANGQPGFACYMQQPGNDDFQLGAVNLLSLRGGRIAWIAGFLDPATHRQFGLPASARSFPPEKSAP